MRVIRFLLLAVFAALGSFDCSAFNNCPGGPAPSCFQIRGTGCVSTTAQCCRGSSSYACVAEWSLTMPADAGECTALAPQFHCG